MYLRMDIKWSSMTGFGPMAWNRDSKVMAMHHTARHPEHNHHIERKTVENKSDERRPSTPISWA